MTTVVGGVVILLYHRRYLGNGTASMEQTGPVVSPAALPTLKDSQLKQLQMAKKYCLDVSTKFVSCFCVCEEGGFHLEIVPREGKISVSTLLLLLSPPNITYQVEKKTKSGNVM